MCKLRFGTILFTLSLAAVGAATTPFTLAWARTYPFPGVESGLAIDGSGNAFALHTEYIGTTPMWVVDKHDPYGTQGWTQSNLFLNSSTAMGISCDPSNNVYVYGNAQSAPPLDADGVIYKLTNQGAVLWFDQFSGPDNKYDNVASVGFDGTGAAYPLVQETISGTLRTIGAIIAPNGNYSMGQQGVALSSFTSSVGPGPLFALNGDSADGRMFAEVMAAGAYAFGEDYPTTTVNGVTKFATYHTSFDPNANLYVARTISTVSAAINSNTFRIRSYDTNGNLGLDTGEISGYCTQIAVGDANTVYYTLSQNGNSTLYSMSKTGSVNWHVDLANAGTLVPDDTGGVFILSTVDPGMTITKYDATGSVAWSTTYVPTLSSSIVRFHPVVKRGALYILGSCHTTSNTSEVFLIKYTQGTGLTAVKLGQSNVTGPQSFSGSVNLNSKAPAGGLKVTLISSDPGHVGVPSYVTVPAGAVSASFNCFCSNVDAKTLVTIQGRAAGCSRSATMALNPYALDSVDFVSTQVKGGVDLNGAVHLAGPAANSGRWVTLTTDQPSVATVASPVYVAPGAMQASIALKTSPVGSNKAVKVTASSNGVSQSTTVTVTP